MRIAICDDDIDQIKNLSFLINEYRILKNIEIELLTFNSSIDLISQFDYKNQIDILLLDIMMPTINGMDAAKEIREIDTNVKIIFITSSSEFAVDSYSVGAYYYTLKPITKDTLFKIFDGLLLDIFNSNSRFVVVKFKNKITRINIRQLEYCEIINKTVLYYLSNGNIIESTGKLADIVKSLSAYPEFLKHHRSFIINMNFIKSIELKEIVMNNNIIIPIPRGKYNNVRQAYMDYIFKK